MDQTAQSGLLGMFSWLLIIGNIIVYFLFKAAGGLLNRVLGRAAVGKRVAGSIGVVVLSIATFWYLDSVLLNESLRKSLSETTQAELSGRILGTILFPAIVVLAVVAFRGWREQRRSSNSKAAGA